MLTDKDRAQLLRDAMELMEQADALVQRALGATDVCYETHLGIESLIEDLQEHVEDLGVRAAGGVL